MAPFLLLLVVILLLAYANGATIEIRSNGEPKIEFYEGNGALASILKGGAGSLNSSTPIYAPDFVLVDGNAVSTLLADYMALRSETTTVQGDVTALQVKANALQAQVQSLRNPRNYASDGVVTTLAGSGSQGSTDATGTSASFDRPNGVAISPDGFMALVTDTYGHKIRAIVIATGVVTTLAGSGSTGSTDATGTSSTFYHPSGVAITPDGSTALVTDTSNHKIRSMVIATGVVTTLAGSGSSGSTDATGTSASFNQPQGVAITPDGSTALVTDRYNHKIRAIVIATGVVTTLAGSGSSGSTDATGTSASFYRPHDVAITPDSSTALVADGYNHKIRAIVIATGVVTTLAGSGSSGSTDATGASASFDYPYGVAITPDGSTALVADHWNHKIRAIVIATGVVTTLAGSGSQGSTDATGPSASFYHPTGVAITPDGFTALMVDRYNHLIRSIAFGTL